MALHRLSKLVRIKKRRGRGIAGNGAKSGRGMKGQRSRAGYSSRAGFEGGQTPLFQRVPKKRGAKQIFPSQVRRPVAISTAQLNTIRDSTMIDIGALRKAGLLERRAQRVKLIGNVPVTRKVTVRVHVATKAATAAVEKAGGTVELT